MGRLRRIGVYEWVDPFEVFDAAAEEIERQDDYHRETVARMAEAHFYAGRKCQADLEALQRTVADIGLLRPIQPFVLRDKVP